MPATNEVNEKIFRSEIKRIDSTLAEQRKVAEKTESKIDRSLESINGKLDKLDTKFDEKIDKISADASNNFRWLVGFYITTTLAVISFLWNVLKS